MCSISREPRWKECTICTAVAPDAVFTVLHIRHPASLRPAISAQIRSLKAKKPQVSQPVKRSDPKRGPTQVPALYAVEEGSPVSD